MGSNSFVLAIVAASLALGPAPGAPTGPDDGLEALKGNLDLPFNAVGEDEDGGVEIIDQVLFFGQNYEGDGFFYSCDMSGSMKEEAKLRKLQEEVTRNISQFSPEVQFSIVLFDTSLRRFPLVGGPAEATPAMKAAGCAFVLTARAGEGTCALPALLASLSYANQSTAKRKAIIHLSDGRNTCPGKDETLYGQEILREVDRRNVQRIKINTIAIGTAEVDEEWMKELARHNGGRASRVQ